MEISHSSSGSRRSVYSHEHVAWCYDWLAGFYSLGAIGRAKASQIGSLRSGQRVLYVGVGSGRDALLAARTGADLTCIDVSPAMLERLRRKLVDENRSATLISESVFDHVPKGLYDVVVANFFLNMYRADGVAELLNRLRSFLDDDAMLLIADFAPPSGPPIRRFAQACYYWPVNLAAWALGLCALHPIYDYGSYLSDHGLELIERSRVSISNRGPEFFENLKVRSMKTSALAARPTSGVRNPLA